jgi:hypothetical protein
MGLGVSTSGYGAPCQVRMVRCMPQTGRRESASNGVGPELSTDSGRPQPLRKMRDGYAPRLLAFTHCPYTCPTLPNACPLIRTSPSIFPLPVRYRTEDKSTSARECS